MAVMSSVAASPRVIYEPEHLDYAESFAHFLRKEVLPHHASWQSDRVVPRELFAKCAEHGFLAMDVPEVFGGPGIADWRLNCVLSEQSARAGVADALTGPILHTDIVLPYLMASASDEQRGRWLPGVATGELILAIAMTEPGTGSDLAGIRTSAKPVDGGYLVNGAKTFITNGINGDLVVVAARTSADRHRGLSLMVLERGMKGFVRGRQIDKLGQHASDTAELFFEDVFVPAENLLGDEGSGFAQLVSRLIPERLIVAVSSVAECERAFDMTLAYISERTAFGKPIGSFQNSRFAMAELSTKIELARCFVDRCIQRYLDGQCSAREAAMAKWWTTDLLGDVTDAGLQLHGGYGYTTEYEIGRAWIDARVSRIYAGTNEIMKELIGRELGL